MIRNGYLQITPPKCGAIDPAAALQGYARGLFPMGISRDEDDYAWYTHVPRGILPLDGFHVSRSLKRALIRPTFEVSCDRAFENVINACAVGRNGDPVHATWINPPIKNLFLTLHHYGLAHSVETWLNGELVGGVYGLHIGSVFFGESMFSIEPNASKIALFHLVQHLTQQNFKLFDTQQVTPHTKTLGAIEIAEIDYLVTLQNALNPELPWGRFLPHTHQI